MKNIRERIKQLEIENKELKEDIKSLEDCLNGSSKATYTVEVFDKMRSKYEAENMILQKKLGIAIKALNYIASLEEGEEVTIRFDEPYSAEKAREALKEIEGI